MREPVPEGRNVRLYATPRARSPAKANSRSSPTDAFPRLHGDSYAALFKGVREDGTYDVPA